MPPAWASSPWGWACSGKKSNLCKVAIKIQRHTRKMFAVFVILFFFSRTSYLGLPRCLISWLGACVGVFGSFDGAGVVVVAV